MRPVLVAARAAVTRRRLQTWIIGAVVLLTATTSVVALGLLAVSHGPFDSAFGRAAGAHLAVTTAATVPAADLASTAHLSGVTAAAGPYDTVAASMRATGGPLSGARLPPATVVGRGSPAGDVDRLTVDTGHWLTGPGQIVLSREFGGPLAESRAIGSEITLDLPGTPKLTLVGVADSVTGTADAWVWPGDAAVLGTPTGRQMLYRFARASTDAELAADRSEVGAALPADAVTAATGWLTVRESSNRSIAAFVPFVVAFAVLGLVLSVLITANVVNGAVVAGFRVIGVLKTLGFTPGQVVAAYVAQVAVPAIAGSLLGVVGGVALAAPLLAETQRAYDLPANLGGVPVWVTVLVGVGSPVLVAVSALGPALRAGGLAANEAISVGRAPKAGRGFRVRRALAAARLPRPVAFGLGLPFARPARTAGTVIAVMLGAVTLVFAVGLTASLSRIHTAFTRVDAVPVVVNTGLLGHPRPGGVLSGPPPDTPPAATVAATIRAQAGTRRVVGLTEVDAHLAGVSPDVHVDGYDGDASWIGYRMIDGRWYAGGDEVVASSYTLRQTGHRVGDRILLTGPDGSRTVTVTGSFLDGDDDYHVIGDLAVATALESGAGPHTFEIALDPGRDAHAYATALQRAFPGEGVVVDERSTHNDNRTFIVLDTLIGTLTLLLCAVAALGVLNTVVLNTRERRHDIGVLRAVGMTPRQVRAMVVSSMVGLGVLAGVAAVPLGVALEGWIVPRMADAAGTDVPQWIIQVYGPVELLALGAAGVVLAVLGALLPAGWASGLRVANALRAE